VMTQDREKRGQDRRIARQEVHLRVVRGFRGTQNCDALATENCTYLLLHADTYGVSHKGGTSVGYSSVIGYLYALCSRSRVRFGARNIPPFGT
jgi:hypothetical protein